MNSDPSTTPPERPAASSRRDKLLQELVALAVHTAAIQIDSLTTQLADALLQAAAGASEQDVRRYYDAAGLLKKNRYPFHYLLSERLTALLTKEICRFSPAPEAAAGSDVDARPVLPADLEIDKKLCLIKAAQAIEIEHAARIAAFNHRLAALLDRDPLATADNPFRPQVFLNALHEAWCEFQPDTGSHHLVFRLLGPELCLDVGPILHALNNLLARNGVSAQPASLIPGASATPPAPPDAELPADDPLALALRRLFPSEPRQAVPDRPLAGAFPALFQDDATKATLARRELLGLLTRMPHKFSTLLSADIRKQVPELEVAPQDDHTIGLVARIFDTIRANDHLADELKAMILSLHLPVLRIAIADTGFFFRPAHPARRALELLVQAALGWERRKGPSDPVYPLVARCVQRLRREADRRTAVFAEAVTELEAFLQREESAAAPALAAPIAQALQQEKQLICTKAARHDVALRVGTGEVAAFVETFLEDKWVAVLTLAYGVKEEKPLAVQSAVKTMDDLVWSVKPKITAAERKELLSRLPGMIAMLNKWLDLIQWQGDDRSRFFDDLARCHASIVRAPLEVTPERQVELAIEAAQKAAERRMQRRAAQAPSPPDKFDHMVESLQAGTWIAFARHAGEQLKLCVAWVSPQRNLILFATRERKEALSMTAEELAQALRAQQAELVPAAGLINRTLAEALGVDDSDRIPLKAA